ncbi:hypothetical protein HNR60_003041 [Rhodopseudomonas rhenobacensis]|uniref:Secretin/TonB short N-terminal domain-containing protein n=1 Tax=Rhodopseudomonas rhenobacensis TaxID=87461 RepID=A0A7W7Z5A7_9BRAD|nr:STN domain-containing protein [Rhodopseudomonas rhenobacensis]MBB5048278.1 hypothetical protein [Rhodopseudomonas rhenobacensis]
MQSDRLGRRRFASGVSLAMGLTAAHFSPAYVQQASAQQPRHEIRFDIPSQSLADALVVYARSTGLEILADDGVVSGRRSTAVSGELNPTIALRRMLAETGLEIHYLDRGAVTLLPSRGPGGEPGERATDRYASFSAALQVALVRAMCGYDGGRAAASRVAAQLWIALDGSIERSLLLDSTGDRRRDAAILAQLETLTVGQARPADLPQPATVILASRSSQDNAGCRPVRRAGVAP